MSLKTSVDNYKRAKRIFTIIDNSWYDLETGHKKDSDYVIENLLRKIDMLQSIVKKVNISDFKGHFSDKAIKAAEQNLKVFEEAAYYWEKVFIRIKYIDDLEAVMIHKYLPDVLITPYELKKYQVKDLTDLAKKLAAAITHPDVINNYKSQIKRLANGTMTQREFNRVFDFLKTKIIVPKEFAKKYQKMKEELMPKKFRITPFEELNEDFHNPFDNDDTIKKNEPKHIKDTNGALLIRKEAFNPSRLEVSKRNGKYTVQSRTQFARGEIIEVCPTILVGSEVTAVDKLKDVVFEIDSAKDQWAVVLGYGSLYKHSNEPNMEYAYNRLTKQMQFLAKRPIQMGEELTINYGTDYWMARQSFNTLGNIDEPKVQVEPVLVGKADESEVQPNKADADERQRKAIFAEPNKKSNPAVSGISIKGIGQQ